MSLSDWGRLSALALSVIVGCVCAAARYDAALSCTPESYWVTWPDIEWERRTQGRRVLAPKGVR